MNKQKIALKLISVSLMLQSAITMAAVSPPTPHAKPATPSPVAGDMSQVVQALQQQIQQVADSVPKQLQQQQIVNQKALATLQQQMQKQVSVLQQQIQQVQDTLSKQINAVQKEVNDIESVK